MPSRLISALAILLLAPSFAFPEAPRGIPRELARQRAAAISDVRYGIAFVFAANTNETMGAEELSFNLQAPQPVLLDFRDGKLISGSVNASAGGFAVDNGHIVLAAEKLRAGENNVHFQFSVPVAAA